MAESKVCRTCEAEKPLSAFYSYPPNLDGLETRCKECKKEYSLARHYANRKTILAKGRESYRKNGGLSKEERRRANLKHSYGMTLEEYQERFDAQNGVCAICSEAEPRKMLAVDHCHVSGQLRALLCTKCNTGIGLFRDDPTLLERAIAYLVRWSE